MTTNEPIFIGILFEIRGFEDRCKRLRTPIAVPPIVYERSAALREAIAEWGIDCVVEERRQEATPSAAFQRKREYDE